MTLARRPIVLSRARRAAVAVAVVTAGLVGLQLWQPVPADALTPNAPPSTASATPDPASTSATPSPASTSATSSPTRVTAKAAVAGPVAVDDYLHLQAFGYANAHDVAYAANDQAGAAPLRLASTTFPNDQPQGVAGADHQSVSFDDLGIIDMLSPSSRMQFYGFGQPGTAVARYRIVDANGASSEALVTVVVGPGGGADLAVRQDHPGSVDVLVGDIPGYDADGTPGTIDQTSVHFTPSSGSLGSTVSGDGRTLTDPVRGVFTADPKTGVVTFVPKNTYRASQVPFVDDYISYVARDTTRAADGSVEHHSYRGRLLLHVDVVDPQPVDDLRYTPHHASVTLPGVTDDLPGDPTAPLRLDLTVFVLDFLPTGSTLYDHGRGLKVPGQGWWTIDAGGTITFTPVAAWVGEASTVSYRLFDANGGTAVGQEEVHVQPGPSAKADAATTAQNVTVGVDAPANDTPGTSADGNPGVIDRATVRFSADGQPAGATLSASDRALTVPGQGVYTIDPTTGVVAFDPETPFVGTASPVAYSERDTVRRRDGRLVHNLTSSTVTLTVTPVTPVAVPDSAVTSFGRGVDIAVLGNDRPGAPTAPLVPSSVRFSNGDRTLTVAGQGVFVVRTDGVVAFTPALGFAGKVDAVAYQVSDANGTIATATLAVKVTGAAVLRPTTATTRAGQPVVVDVLSNDEPPSGAGWDRSSVCVVAGSTCREHATRPGVGSWTVDPVDGTITFASTSGFTGDARVSYAVHDTVVGTYTSTLTVTVAPAREAKND
ncbi:MAG: Ig-like domain-containing protein [Janthinobacterium lividum]